MTAKPVGGDQAAARLHHPKFRTRQLPSQFGQVGLQQRRQVGIRRGGVTAGGQPDLRADLVRSRYLAKPGFAGERREALFVVRVTVPVQQHHRDGRVSLLPQAVQLPAEHRFVQRFEHGTVGRDAFRHLDHAVIQH